MFYLDSVEPQVNEVILERLESQVEPRYGEGEEAQKEASRSRAFAAEWVTPLTANSLRATMEQIEGYQTSIFKPDLLSHQNP